MLPQVDSIFSKSFLKQPMAIYQSNCVLGKGEYTFPTSYWSRQITYFTNLEVQCRIKGVKKQISSLDGKRSNGTSQREMDTGNVIYLNTIIIVICHSSF